MHPNNTDRMQRLHRILQEAHLLITSWTWPDIEYGVHSIITEHPDSWVGNYLTTRDHREWIWEKVENRFYPANTMLIYRPVKRKGKW